MTAANPNIYKKREGVFSSEVATPTPPEQERFTKKQKGIAAIVLALTIGTGGYFAGKSNSENKNILPPKPAVSESINLTNPSESKTQEQSIPKESESFISEFGARYKDPVSTYYAVEAYKRENNDKTPIITDEFINNYDPSGQRSMELSTLGFTAQRIPIDTQVDRKKMVEIFNEYTIPNLELYLNYLSKNRSPAALSIIDREFQDYCSDTSNKLSPILAFKDDDDDILRMMTLAKRIVAEYGDTVNYKIATASDAFDAKGPNFTTFPPTSEPSVGVTKWNGQTIESFAKGGVNISIGLDKYDNKNKLSSSNKILKGINLTMQKQPVTGSSTWTYLSIGLIESVEPVGK
jgi:hypothetical protein